MKANQKGKSGPVDFDRLVGRVIRERRIAAGLSQAALGPAIGVTYQQMTKYERGLNRIGPGMLHELAKELGTTGSDLLAQAEDEANDQDAGKGHTAEAAGRRRSLLHLNRAASSISNQKALTALVTLAKSLGGVE